MASALRRWIDRLLLGDIASAARREEEEARRKLTATTSAILADHLERESGDHDKFAATQQEFERRLGEVEQRVDLYAAEVRMLERAMGGKGQKKNG